MSIVHTHPSEESLADLPVPWLLLADGYFLFQFLHWYNLLKLSLMHKIATCTFSDKQNCFMSVTQNLVWLIIHNVFLIDTIKH